MSQIMQNDESFSIVNQKIEAALRSAIGAVACADEESATALLALSDPHLGRLFKQGLRQALPLSRAIALTFPPLPTVKPSVWGMGNTAGPTIRQVLDESAIYRARKNLVTSKKLIQSASLVEGLGISRQALSKAVASHRIFTLDVGAETYFPAFYLDPTLERKQVERVSQKMGALTGWSKWQFFTEPKGALGGKTPVEALKDGQYRFLLQCAQAFAE